MINSMRTDARMHSILWVRFQPFLQYKCIIKMSIGSSISISSSVHSIPELPREERVHRVKKRVVKNEKKTEAKIESSKERVRKWGFREWILVILVLVSILVLGSLSIGMFNRVDKGKF